MQDTQTETLSQSQQVYNHLKRAINNCKYMPGQEISEKMLFEELPFGRTPIRETLLQLQKEGLVEIFPRRGMRIAPITNELVNDLYQTRKIIEPNVAMSFAALYPKQKLFEYEHLLRYSGNMTDEEFYSLDIKFHIFLVDTAQNKLLSSIFSDLMWHQYRLAMYAAMLRKNTREANDPEHLRIIHAILEENATEIRSAIIQHINSSMLSTFRSLDLV